MRRKVGDMLREMVAMTKYMQAAGKARLTLLLVEVFLLIIITGILLETVTITYFILAVVGSILYVAFIAFRTLWNK